MLRSTLYRLFRHVDGGVTTVLRQRRIEHAQALLIAAEEVSPAVVALACGFRSERQYYRVFKQELGLPPGQFREEHRRHISTVN